MGVLLLPQQVSVELYSDIQCKKKTNKHGKWDYNLEVQFQYYNSDIKNVTHKTHA